LGEIRENTTDHLVADLERLRARLGIARWVVFGGSWGSNLALAYGQAHPDREMALILRGIFLMRRAEIHWFLYDMRTIFPDAWERFASHVTEGEHRDLLEAYWRRLTDPDPAVHLAAAKAWSIYEGTCSTLLPSPELVAASGEDVHALGLARIEAHYFRNNLFTPEDRLLRDVGKLHAIPTVIVQGRYDTVCPMSSAWDLHRAWPGADFRIVSDAGHSAMEPGIRAALVAATERFRHLRA
jgi:proline iminopeptidase